MFPRRSLLGASVLLALLSFLLPPLRLTVVDTANPNTWLYEVFRVPIPPDGPPRAAMIRVWETPLAAEVCRPFQVEFATSAAKRDYLLGKAFACASLVAAAAVWIAAVRRHGAAHRSLWLLAAAWMLVPWLIYTSLAAPAVACDPQPGVSVKTVALQGLWFLVPIASIALSCASTLSVTRDMRHRAA